MEKLMLSPMTAKCSSNTRYSLKMDSDIKGLKQNLEKSTSFFKQFKKDFQGETKKPRLERNTQSMSLLPPPDLSESQFEDTELKI